MFCLKWLVFSGQWAMGKKTFYCLLPLLLVICNGLADAQQRTRKLVAFLLGDDSENVFFRQQDVLVSAQLDVGTGVLGIENLVAYFNFGFGA